MFDLRSRIRRFAILRGPISVLLVTLGVSSVFAQPVIFEDDTFNDVDWALKVFLWPVGGGTIDAFQAPDLLFPEPGIPSPFRRIQHVLTDAPTNPAQQSGVFGFHRSLGSVYNPALLGAIDRIDYSEDSRLFVGGGAGQATGPIVFQDDKYYFRRPNLLLPDFSWETKHVNSLTEDNFHEITNFLTGLPQDKPNFSANGKPITFGFFRANATGVGQPGYVSDAGIDNWKIVVHRKQISHLKCVDVKDLSRRSRFALRRTFVDLISPQFGPDVDCNIIRATRFCAPVEKTVVSTPLDLIPFDGPPLMTDFICYKVRCNNDMPDQEVTDQFGFRTIVQETTEQELCVPAMKGEFDPNP